uniref:Uncharacterized protein n=1 Tax=Anguilla anguilla TaxID=7936 RepID=A0A0E9VHS8_ANGAN
MHAFRARTWYERLVCL